MPSTPIFSFEVLVNNIPLPEYSHTFPSNGAKSYIICPPTPKTRYTVRVQTTLTSLTYAARLQIDGVAQGGYVLEGASDAEWEGRPINADEMQPFHFAPAQWDFERSEDREKAKMIGTISVEFSEIEVMGEMEHPVYGEGNQAIVEEGSGRVATYSTGYGEKERTGEQRPFMDVKNLRDTPDAVLVVENIESTRSLGSAHCTCKAGLPSTQDTAQEESE
ncbi:hypothetical protein HK097_006552 [Rhizophlyctis rosea]|uniref:Uncharacterized protein n=1 Tax=Rhizophlyctis rosea TaxID=64517 RepID=A0AAD5SD66_9FUNG|nr:hypothetical protein HK097_006552 [Rhizophlyctis rosea]